MSDLPANIPQCQHVRHNGIRCGSPALRGHSHCYYHNYIRKPSRAMGEFEDAESIQLALRQVINWLSLGMETKRAALMLYALQIASCNLRHLECLYWTDVVRELPKENPSDAEMYGATTPPPFPPQSAVAAANDRVHSNQVGTIAE